MTADSRVVARGPDARSVRTAGGEVLQPPEGWVLRPPGDATLTRRVKAAGPTRTVQENVGRKPFSRGVWAPQVIVDRVRAGLAAERATPQYQQRREADVRRRREQSNYVEEFRRAVLDFLAFDARHADLAGRLAEAVTEHTTPVGCSTVARTKRIPVERRAEAAVIAWMRHRTTACEGIRICCVRGRFWPSSPGGCSTATAKATRWTRPAVPCSKPFSAGRRERAGPGGAGWIGAAVAGPSRV